ncbi:MAG: two pore domain potassium channel family protein [Flavobacteriales bacterium]|nr:two pore domain potassium channel family protein [Bacteroidota bacterium]MCB9241654.1 two pore domain potassium channel family protein [Flavobacteriales bacterium]
MSQLNRFLEHTIFFKTILSFLKDREYRGLIYITLFVLVAGTIVYHYMEGWRWIDALYFCVITLTTVGYGDFSPQTDGGKLFTIFYIIVGIGIILSFIDALYTHFNRHTLERRNKR